MNWVLFGTQWLQRSCRVSLVAHDHRVWLCVYTFSKAGTHKTREDHIQKSTTMWHHWTKQDTTKHHREKPERERNTLSDLHKTKYLLWIRTSLIYIRLENNKALFDNKWHVSQMNMLAWSSAILCKDAAPEKRQLNGCLNGCLHREVWHAWDPLSTSPCLILQSPGCMEVIFYQKLTFRLLFIQTSFYRWI